MPPKPQPEPPYFQQLQDSINALATSFNTFRVTQDQRHEDNYVPLRKITQLLTHVTISSNIESNQPFVNQLSGIDSLH